MKQQQAIQYLAFDVHQATIVANCRDAETKPEVGSELLLTESRRTTEALTLRVRAPT